MCRYPKKKKTISYHTNCSLFGIFLHLYVLGFCGAFVLWTSTRHTSGPQKEYSLQILANKKALGTYPCTNARKASNLLSRCLDLYLGGNPTHWLVYLIQSPQLQQKWQGRQWWELSKGRDLRESLGLTLIGDWKGQIVCLFVLFVSVFVCFCVCLFSYFVKGQDLRERLGPTLIGDWKDQIGQNVIFIV